MYGVVRFLDTELLPASSPEDYPKIIKSGIDEEFQHHKSPKVTGPCGIATLLHRIGRPQLLERLLDVDGTRTYDLRVRSWLPCIQDVYVKRRENNVEIGFMGSDGRLAQHGVRYIITPPNLPHGVGQWIPVSTSDLDSGWGGSDIWVRGQGAYVAKGIWFHQHFDSPNLEVSWSGMTELEKENIKTWLEERAERLKQQRNINKNKVPEEADGGMRDYYNSRLACRADCGMQDAMFACSKCKIARYCSKACQADDWKYHKTYCGEEPPIPKKYM